eukprot:UN17227
MLSHREPLLQKDLIQIILNHFTLLDAIRFSRVCQSWLKATADLTFHSEPTLFDITSPPPKRCDEYWLRYNDKFAKYGLRFGDQWGVHIYPDCLPESRRDTLFRCVTHIIIHER